MFRKCILMAAAATAALGFAVFNPSLAEAKGHGGGGGGGGMHRGGGGGMHRGGGGHHGRGHHGHPGRHYHHRHWHVRWHRPVWYGYSYARPVVAAPGPCTCLSKEYTPEGAVLFKDRCTNEMAMNPPPQQTGAVDQPQQPQAGYQQQYVQPQPQNLQPQTNYTPQYPPQAAR